MIIVNADDWGRSRADTEPALICFKEGRISSASAMVFMEDSGRAAELARGLGMDIGLHLNLSQSFSGEVPATVRQHHERIIRFLKRSKYALILYHPLLREPFRVVFQAQAEEFERLYGKPPSHVDGHQHMHVCSNMLLDAIIPKGQKVRRSFTFLPGEKGFVNRAYRRWVDCRLSRRYRLTDYFFGLSQRLKLEKLKQVFLLAREANVELMTHPVVAAERELLLSAEYGEILKGVKMGSYAAL